MSDKKYLQVGEVSILEDRIQLKIKAGQIVSAMDFGQPVTNICAGSGNPHRHGYFVQSQVGKDSFVEMTDKSGSFWKVGITVVYPGWLDIKQCEDLFAPIHKILYPQSYNPLTHPKGDL